MNQKVAVGIDLGTNNCCIAVVHNEKVEVIENEFSSRQTPNYVSFTETECLHGAIAQSQAVMNLCDTIFDAKQLIGRQIDNEIIQKNKLFWPFEIKEINGKLKVKARYKQKEELFAPEEISAMVLTKLKETAEAHVGQKIKDVVISVPANFNNSQRVETLNAGEKAGFEVLRLIHEPTAAALTYNSTKEVGKETNLLLFDFGSSKLDVSIVNIRASSIIDVEVKASDGDNLGGSDINRLMVKYLIDLFNKEYNKDMNGNKKSIRRLVTAWEKAKIILSSNKETSIIVDSLFEGIDFHATITRAKFEEVCESLLTSILVPVENVLDDAKVDKSQIDEIVLVGGSTRIPKVQQLLIEFFGGKQLNKSLNADEAVAYGAALQAEYLLRNNENIRITDIIPYNLEYCNEKGNVIPVFQKGSKLSQKKSLNFSFQKENINIELFQSSRLNRVELGSITMFDIPPKPEQRLVVPVKFDLDCDGILKVSALNIKTDKYEYCEIRNDIKRVRKRYQTQVLCKEERYEEDENHCNKQVKTRNIKKICKRRKRFITSATKKILKIVFLFVFIIFLVVLILCISQFLNAT